MFTFHLLLQKLCCFKFWLASAGVVSIATICKLFPMPPKKKDSSTTPVALAPKQKRSKTSFRTPTMAGLEDTSALASKVGLTKNQVITL